jgi:hypothetical protein
MAGAISYSEETESGTVHCGLAGQAAVCIGPEFILIQPQPFDAAPPIYCHPPKEAITTLYRAATLRSFRLSMWTATDGTPMIDLYCDGWGYHFQIDTTAPDEANWVDGSRA